MECAGTVDRSYISRRNPDLLSGSERGASASFRVGKIVALEIGEAVATHNAQAATSAVRQLLAAVVSRSRGMCHLWNRHRSHGESGESAEATAPGVNVRVMLFHAAKLHLFFCFIDVVCLKKVTFAIGMHNYATECISRLGTT